jgi:hypothetical protein
MTAVYQLFLPIVGIVILIWLLTLLQYGIDSAIPQNTRGSEEQKYATDKHKADINEARHSSVANAIHTYRRTREADERDRAKREWVTIIVLISTAIFALLAAVAAGTSAWIFYGQLDEMRAAREASDRSAADQLKLLGDQTKAIQGQLSQMALAERPWVMLTDIKPQSLSSDDEAGVSFWVKLSVKNVGHSPAQNVSVTGQLLIHDSSQFPEPTMRAVCHETQGSFVIPGQVLFPDQTQNVDGDNPRGFDILAERIWAARDARIKSVDRTHYVNPARAEAWIAELSKFPFHAQLDLVGCINYRSPDNSALYQTGFIFSVGAKPNGNPLPLLSGEPVPDTPPDISDPDVAIFHVRRMQRVVPGDEIQLGIPSYGSFVN